MMSLGGLELVEDWEADAIKTRHSSKYSNLCSLGFAKNGDFCIVWFLIFCTF